MKRKRPAVVAGGIVILLLTAILWKIHTDLLPLPKSLVPDAADIQKARILDRNGIPLTVTYQNRWNVHERLPLHQIPSFLQQAFIASEDKRFYEHGGIDRLARLHALWQNAKAFGAVRGASTITEQVVRMWHPRKRSLWSRFLEGIEAIRLEKKFSKAEIFEFYLNQVPYAGNRRGVFQAARACFDRDLDTLSRKEMLALVVMVRAPSRLNLHGNEKGVAAPVARLLSSIQAQGGIDGGEADRIRKESIELRDSGLSAEAAHFIDTLYRSLPSSFSPMNGQIRTTLDASLQSAAKTILDNRLADLSRSGVHNAAVVILDNRSHEVLAWVTSGERSGDIAGSYIDAAATPRQPGSTLKPFLYALALEKGWTAATLIDDSPLSEPVGTGLHAYHNYSRTYYGRLPLREALGNSLNIPAIRALQFVGVENLFACLHRLGFDSLQQHPDFYWAGLALGNGEITLFELTKGYSALANQGIYYPPRMILDERIGATQLSETPVRVFSREAASLIGNILSDPSARRLEFGSDGLLDFPVQTAVKTGTSSDYRDAWSVGYTNRYTVGVWMGNLDQGTMDGITGSKGPAMVLRSIFAELNRNCDTEPLYLSPRLVRTDICRTARAPADGHCSLYSEWFVPGTEPEAAAAVPADPKFISLLQPSAGLQLSMDPRIPDDHEAFPFKLSEIPTGSLVDWYVDGRLLATTSGGRYLWPMRRGGHIAEARIRHASADQGIETVPVTFVVK